MTTSTQLFRNLTAREQSELESRGVVCSDWNRIRISENTDLGRIRNVRLSGDVHIGANVTIENVGLLEMDSSAMCGLGTEVCVLDETGSRSVKIFPGLSAQLATLIARDPEWAQTHANPIINKHIEEYPVIRAIGDGASITNCGSIRNVAIGREVIIDGAVNLRNGMIVNNAPSGKALAGIGAEVNAENFIIEDGIVDSGVIIRNCYIGQGAVLEKGFSIHDSLVFANCSLENGEGCAIFAGPYTVSMHKSTLLIGCQTSFFNAGSGTNQSNHMYKLGPQHWGVLERGVKTSSGAYIMLGARIGAYSLVMGQHKTHPDTSDFPFSYLFGDERGNTTVDPGAMLRSCGLVRDEHKWPERDRRKPQQIPCHDRIIFEVLNPATVGKIVKGIDIIHNILANSPDNLDSFIYKGLKFTRKALVRAKKIYYLAVCKYLHLHTAGSEFSSLNTEVKASEWVDIAGLPMPRYMLQKAMIQQSVQDMENIFDEAFLEYGKLQMQWIAGNFGESWNITSDEIAARAAEYDSLIEDDRSKYLADIASHTEMLKL